MNNVFVDLSDSFLDSFDHDLQNHSDTDLKMGKIMKKEDKIDGPDHYHFQNQNGF